MASRPGILTDWPWKRLGVFKYVVIAPWAIHNTYSFITTDKEEERDLSSFLIFPFLLFRMLHNQLWISLSRYKTAKGSNRIVDKSIDFEQVDRERDWDDQVIFNGLLFFLGREYVPNAKNIPFFRLDGCIITALLHAGPVEFLYYWLHRALHHHFLYSRYHSHHHSSIATEPITSVIHPFAEHIAYFFLFAIPLYTTIRMCTASIVSFAIYETYIDFMNNMGHCNFELIPNWLFSVFPPLKYLMYTPSFHSLHHTQFRTNYSLFMPFYDYVYGTTDKSSDELHKASLERKDEAPDVVHLTHLTTPESIYHMRLGFASLASKPYKSRWYLWAMWPVTVWSMVLTWVYGKTFTVERNQCGHLKLQTWAIPKYKIQYFLEWQRESINNLIEEAILDAEEKGAKVLSLGLLNQGEELNKNGDLYVQKFPKLKLKLVDGSSLAVAVVLNSIPQGATQILMRGHLTKVAYYVADALCQKGVRVVMTRETEYDKLKTWLNSDSVSNLAFSRGAASKTNTWLVGDGLSEEEQRKAPKGTVFIPFSQIPPRKFLRDCFYLSTPALSSPSTIENVDSCENWLPRRVMSAWRVAGIVHALEGWSEHECGRGMMDTEKVWQATLRHGFQPLKSKSA
ncbi:unnamed protein product [Rhodiola kirilowii]